MLMGVKMLRSSTVLWWLCYQCDDCFAGYLFQSKMKVCTWEGQIQMHQPHSCDVDNLGSECNNCTGDQYHLFRCYTNGDDQNPQNSCPVSKGLVKVCCPCSCTAPKTCSCQLKIFATSALCASQQCGLFTNLYSTQHTVNDNSSPEALVWLCNSSIFVYVLCLQFVAAMEHILCVHCSMMMSVPRKWLRFKGSMAARYCCYSNAQHYHIFPT